MFRFYRWFLPLILLICLSPLMLTAGCLFDENMVGWNYQYLVKQLDKKQTFVFYFGTDKCPACQTAKKILYNNSEVKSAINEFKTKTGNEYAIYWYSESLVKPSSQRRSAFQTKLNALFKKRNPTTFVEISGIPHLIFIKNGKLIGQLTGSTAIEKEFVNYLNKLT